MAKRKSRSSKAKLHPKKKIPKLETVFGCPFCGFPSSVDYTYEKDLNLGIIECHVCQEKYCSKLTPLKAPIDIYYEWIDECERVNQDQEA